MNIVLLGASFSNPNLGVGALAAGTVKCISSSLPGACISLLDYAQRPDLCHVQVNSRLIAIDTVNLRMKPYPANNVICVLAAAAMVRLLPRGRVRDRLVAMHPVLRRLDNGDLFLSLAGGDSFSDIYGLRRIIDVALPQFLVLAYGKPLVLLPQTIGPFKGRFARMLAKAILKRAELIYSRDEESARAAVALIGEQGTSKKIRMCYDLGFLAEVHMPKRIDMAGLSFEGDDERPLVGLNISGLLFIGGYARDDAFGFRDKYIQLVYRLLDLLIASKNVRVLLVPHSLHSGSESDSDVCEQLYEELKGKYEGSLGVVRDLYTASEMKYIIGRCNFFIGSRMHACIGALSQGVPAVSIAYSRKFIGVLETIGAGDLNVDPRMMSIDAILETIASRYDARGEIGARLAERLPEVRRTVLNLIPEICRRTRAGGAKPDIAAMPQPAR